MTGNKKERKRKKKKKKRERGQIKTLARKHVWYARIGEVNRVVNGMARRRNNRS